MAADVHKVRNISLLKFTKCITFFTLKHLHCLFNVFMDYYMLLNSSFTIDKVKQSSAKIIFLKEKKTFKNVQEAVFSTALSLNA